MEVKLLARYIGTFGILPAGTADFRHFKDLHVTVSVLTSFTYGSHKQEISIAHVFQSGQLFIKMPK